MTHPFNRILRKLFFVFHPILMKLGEVVVSIPSVLQLHQISSKSDEKQKSFINSPFFCSEFQSVSRIMKIVHSALASDLPKYVKCKFYIPFSSSWKISSNASIRTVLAAFPHSSSISVCSSLYGIENNFFLLLWRMTIFLWFQNN